MKNKNMRFYTVSEFAKVLRVHVNTVYKAINKGRIQAFRSGVGIYSSYRIPETEATRMMEYDTKVLLDRIVDEKIRKKEGAQKSALTIGETNEQSSCTSKKENRQEKVRARRI